MLIWYIYYNYITNKIFQSKILGAKTHFKKTSMNNTTTPQNPQTKQTNHSEQNLILLSILLAVIVVPSSISGTAIALESIAQSFSDIALYANTLTQSTLAKNLIQDEKWE